MMRVCFVPIVVLLMVFVGLVYVAKSGCDLYSFYSQRMQAPLFTGFLTIGAFLLSLKTFILVKLKEDLYDSDSYRQHLASMRNLNPELSTYGPLKRLSHFLLVCVLAALITSLAQLSIGFIPINYVAAICISLAAATLSTVLFAWWEIRKNLMEWFDRLEEDDRKGRISQVQPNSQ